MPKVKTHSGASKRFKVTKNGKVKLTHAGRRHILNKKSTKLKRHMRKAGYASDMDAVTIKKLLPYA
jgi:large subunit ribosomal protein L35